jgi:hypothetical protein
MKSTVYRRREAPPGSKEALPGECVVHHPEVIRALLVGVGAIDSADARVRRRAARGAAAPVATGALERARLGLAIIRVISW